jgi:hypothetical protein
VPLDGGPIGGLLEQKFASVNTAPKFLAGAWKFIFLEWISTNTETGQDELLEFFGGKKNEDTEHQDIENV